MVIVRSTRLSGNPSPAPSASIISQMDERGREDAILPAPPCESDRSTRGSTAVVVEVSRHGPLDAVPGVSGGVLCLLPAEVALALGTVPAALEVGLDLVPASAVVLGARLPAVAIGRGVVVVGGAGR